MLLIVSLAAIAATAIAVGLARPALAGMAAAGAAGLCAAALAWSWATDPVAVDLGWLPSLGSRFALSLDGLGAPLAVYAAGMAVPVLVYAGAYMPRHLERQGRPVADAAPFAAMLLCFALAMILLMLAQDLAIIFLALEATALISYLLIRFDENAESLRSARLALVVTAGSSLLFLAGLVMIAAETGTTALAGLRRAGAAGTIPDAAIACLVAGVLAKSAQAPLHFWLPRAMVAPTPVSAYLHSAALVAAGVFVLQRIHFLLMGAPWLLDGLFWLGFLSIGVGALFALAADEFKRVLAYSTIAQYGYCVVLLAAGGAHGFVGAPFFIVAHGLGKCALFMTAGAVTQGTGEHRLSQSGGLARSMPLLAAASFVAAAAVAGLPLTIGFFKDDLFLKAALGKGTLATVLATAALALTLAYLARFWFGIFGGGRSPAPPHPAPQTPVPSGPAPAGLSLPVAALALLALLFGIWTAPLEPVFAAAASVIAGEPTEAHLAYPAGLTPELQLSLVAWGAGLALWLGLGRLAPAIGAVARGAGRVGPAAAADLIGAGGRRLSDLMHGLEVRDARNRLSAIFLASAFIVMLGIIADSAWPRTGTIDSGDLPLAAALAVAAAAAPLTMAARGHVAFLLVLSFVGIGLAVAFALGNAPEVALVLVLVETILTLLFIAVLSNMRHEVLIAARRQPGGRLALGVGVLAGIAGTATAWLALSAPPGRGPIEEYVILTGAAHGRDVVTVILADFRGLDTAGELTVVVVAIIGAVTIWAERRP